MNQTRRRGRCVISLNRISAYLNIFILEYVHTLLKNEAQI